MSHEKFSRSIPMRRINIPKNVLRLIVLIAGGIWEGVIFDDYDKSEEVAGPLFVKGLMVGLGTAIIIWLLRDRKKSSAPPPSSPPISGP